MFNQQELVIIANLINRVQITGQESTTVALLLQKINGIAQSMQPQQEAPEVKEEAKKE